MRSRHGLLPVVRIQSREWIPVDRQACNLLVVLLLLTVVCRSALPCGCARCDFGQGCAAANCDTKSCPGEHGECEHRDRGALAQGGGDHSNSCDYLLGREDSSPALPKSTCDCWVVAAPEPASSLKSSVPQTVTFDRPPFCSTNPPAQSFRLHAEQEGGGLESLLLRECVRLQV